MHCIQHTLGKHFAINSINYFAKGLFFRSNHCEILVETDNYLSRIQVIVGVLEKFCDDRNDRIIKGECEDVLWKIFHDIVYVKVAENNNCVPLTKKILSLSGLKDERYVYYAFDRVIEHCNSRHKLIYHTESGDDEKTVYDDISLLLTTKEKKVSVNFLLIMVLYGFRL